MINVKWKKYALSITLDFTEDLLNQNFLFLLFALKEKID